MKPVLICQQCGKEFTDPLTRHTRPKKFCSPECLAAAKRTGFAHASGYRYTKRNGRYFLEHRIVVEEIIGRKLSKHEQVHHINGIKSDNRPENLKIVTARVHSFIHNHLKGRWSKAYDACVVCGTNQSPHQARGMCHTCYERARYHKT